MAQSSVAVSLDLGEMPSAGVAGAACGSPAGAAGASEAPQWAQNA